MFQPMIACRGAKEEGAHQQGQICGLARETDGPWPAPLPCGDALVVG